MVGYCYENGTWTSIDKQKVFELYQKAENIRNTKAQCNLALMYKKNDEKYYK